jgi:hypothetical protein
MRKAKTHGLTAGQVEELRTAWKALCAANFAEMGDYGTCVLGAGLEANGVQIVAAHDVCPAQGCCVWEKGLHDLYDAFNAKHGTTVRYNAGMMD